MSQIIGGHTFVPLEKNIDDVKLNAITGGATITSELISTQTQSTSAVTGDQLLLLKSGGNLARILSTDLGKSTAIPSTDTGNMLVTGSDGLLSLPSSTIWNMRLRSYNAIGNPGFEVDSRNCFNAVANIATGAFGQDRWQVFTIGTMKATYQASQGQASVFAPGTSFLISQGQAGISVTTTEASLAAGDYWIMQQSVEGPNWRELSQDATSISLMVYTSVAGLKFAVALRDSANSRSLVKLCTVPNANTWTLITLPNIPKPTSGTFAVTSGGVAYQITICLACGSTYIAPATDTWQAGNFLGASTMSNLFATAGASFIAGFIQHEPGPLCTQLIDIPFGQNLDGPMGCTRYFQKTYSYATAIGTNTQAGTVYGFAPPGYWAQFPVMFEKRMAKVPTITGYSVAGTAGWVYDTQLAGNRQISATLPMAGERSFGGFQLATTNAANTMYQFHYTADTGW